MASISGVWQAVQILRPDGARVGDIRPLVRLGINVVVGEGDRQESGSYGAGGRTGYDLYLDPATWKAAADEALRQALVNLGSVPAPAGEMPVVLGSGWPGILLHEAIGHGLEGDFNRKKTSAFAGLMGQRVALQGRHRRRRRHHPRPPRLAHRRRRGHADSGTVLIEDGILVGYMQDRLNARLMGMEPTGNGRRESFAHAPMPRMTQHLHAGRRARARGDHQVGEERGLYAVNFGGGQVDITSGKFVFSCTEAY